MVHTAHITSPLSLTSIVWALINSSFRGTQPLL